MRTAVGLGVSVASILVIANAFDLGGTRQIVEQAGWPALVVAAALLSADVVVRSWRWHALLSPLRRLERHAALPHLLLGYLANNALPARLGEVVRCHTLGDREGISRASVAGTVVVERLLDVAVLALVAMVAMVVTPSSGPLAIAIGSALAASAVGCLFVWRIVVGPSGAGLGRFRNWPGFRFVAPFMTRIRTGLSVARSGRAIVRAVVWSAVAWTLTSVAFATTARFVGLDLSPVQVVLFVAGVNLATVVPAGPSNLGTYELAAVSVAAAIGVSPTQALAMAVMVHVAAVSVTSLGGIVSAWYLYVGPLARPIPAPAMVESTEPREN
jgi:uncharacterized membrane protein YbhN (UPF0104 family)